jgi:hypothetical protein
VSWSGNFNRAGVYYVVATNTSSSTIWYRIDVSGAGVTYQTTVAEQAASPVAATSLTEATTTVKAAGGETPDQSLTIPANSVSIAPGATIWHTFQYAGDQSQIRVWLDAQGQSGPGFSVWTPDQMRQYLTGSAVDPVGRGAYDANVSGDLTWSGSFPQNGAYYVQVTNNGSAVIEYTMSMSGSGVW